MTGKIKVGDGPVQLFALPDGATVIVANQGSADAIGDTASILDVTAGLVTNTLRTGAGAHGIVVSPDGTRASISNSTNSTTNTVSEIDIKTMTVIARHLAGDGPNGITFRP